MAASGVKGDIAMSYSESLITTIQATADAHLMLSVSCSQTDSIRVRHYYMSVGRLEVRSINSLCATGSA